MLKLDKSQTINTIALHLNSVPAGVDTLVFIYSQSYDLSNGQMDFYVDATKGKYLIGGVSGSQVPSPTGQYDIDIYSGSFVSGVWQTTNVAWSSFNGTWTSNGYYVPAGDLLRTIRAWISGSNDVPIKEYISSNELGTYTTYNS